MVDHIKPAKLEFHSFDFRTVYKRAKNQDLPCPGVLRESGVNNIEMTAMNVGQQPCSLPLFFTRICSCSYSSLQTPLPDQSYSYFSFSTKSLQYKDAPYETHLNIWVCNTFLPNHYNMLKLKKNKNPSR